MTNEGRTPEETEHLNRKQLEIYARELSEHVQSERKLRQVLEGRNNDLEQRIREITALNQLFQKHLDERTVVVKAYTEVLDGLKQFSSGATALEEWARNQPVPDLDDLPPADVAENNKPS